MWPDDQIICKILAYFQNWKFAQSRKRFAKVDLKFCKNKINLQKLTKYFYNLAKSDHTVDIPSGIVKNFKMK